MLLLTIQTSSSLSPLSLSLFDMSSVYPYSAYPNPSIQQQVDYDTHCMTIRAPPAPASSSSTVTAAVATPAATSLVRVSDPNPLAKVEEKEQAKPKTKYDFSLNNRVLLDKDEKSLMEYDNGVTIVMHYVTYSVFRHSIDLDRVRFKVHVDFFTGTPEVENVKCFKGFRGSTNGLEGSIVELDTLDDVERFFQFLFTRGPPRYMYIENNSQNVHMFVDYDMTQSLARNMLLCPISAFIIAQATPVRGEKWRYLLHPSCGYPYPGCVGNNEREEEVNTEEDEVQEESDYAKGVDRVRQTCVSILTDVFAMNDKYKGSRKITRNCLNDWIKKSKVGVLFEKIDSVCNSEELVIPKGKTHSIVIREWFVKLNDRFGGGEWMRESSRVLEEYKIDKTNFVELTIDFCRAIIQFVCSKDRSLPFYQLPELGTEKKLSPLVVPSIISKHKEASLACLSLIGTLICPTLVERRRGTLNRAQNLSYAGVAKGMSIRCRHTGFKCPVTGKALSIEMDSIIQDITSHDGNSTLGGSLTVTHGSTEDQFLTAVRRHLPDYQYIESDNRIKLFTVPFPVCNAITESPLSPVGCPPSVIAAASAPPAPVVTHPVFSPSPVATTKVRATPWGPAKRKDIDEEDKDRQQARKAQRSRSLDGTVRCLRFAPEVNVTTSAKRITATAEGAFNERFHMVVTDLEKGGDVHHYAVAKEPIETDLELMKLVMTHCEF